MARTVTVDGGVRYGDLCGPLHAAGFALHNLASLPHISVAGACATATHGSGDGREPGDGGLRDRGGHGGRRIVTFDRDRDRTRSNGAVVALGGLGVVTG